MKAFSTIVMRKYILCAFLFFVAQIAAASDKVLPYEDFVHCDPLTTREQEIFKQYTAAPQELYDDFAELIQTKITSSFDIAEGEKIIWHSTSDLERELAQAKTEILETGVGKMMAQVLLTKLKLRKEVLEHIEKQLRVCVDNKTQLSSAVDILCSIAKHIPSAGHNCENNICCALFAFSCFSSLSNFKKVIGTFAFNCKWEGYASEILKDKTVEDKNYSLALSLPDSLKSNSFFDLLNTCKAATKVSIISDESKSHCFYVSLEGNLNVNINFKQLKQKIQKKAP